jgi:hypothetical protein
MSSLPGWDELDRELTEPGSLRVFVPSIMGLGLIGSLAMLGRDLARRAFPKTRAAHSELRARRRAVRLVGPVARAVGVEIAEPPPIRRLRSRRFYVIAAMLAISYSLYVLVGSTANFLRPYGPFSGNLAMQIVSSILSAVALVAGVVATVVWLWYDHPPRWARRVVEHSPLGELEI